MESMGVPLPDGFIELTFINIIMDDWDKYKKSLLKCIEIETYRKKKGFLNHERNEPLYPIHYPKPTKTPK